ncbi:hypothetical protein C8Q77DRAFT_1159490 [Trametes polyzona]|nr:hypothetical protein C8Q77DRAFT_1159490 [Trametes polyzona]
MDEEDVPLSQRKDAASKDSNDSGYTIRGVLKVPRATTFTCQALYEQIVNQDVDLQPEYQRDVVWPDTKQMGLIDSIFRNFYVPPVIFVVHTTDDGAERRVCIDGKQRLTSISRFIGGEIPYRDTFTGEKFVFKAGAQAKGEILPEKYRKMFLNKSIVCMEYQDITPENEREIFQASPRHAERLQAINSPMTKFIRELLDNYILDRIAAHIEWDTSRANDFRGLANAVYGMIRWPELTTLPSITVIEKWLQDSRQLGDATKEDIESTFKIFEKLAQDKKLSKCFSLPGVKKVAPVEFLSISLLIHSFKEEMTLAQLAEAIVLLRKDIRAAEKDVRQNSRTMKRVLSFLKNLSPSQLKEPSGEPAAPRKKKRSRGDSSEASSARPAQKRLKHAKTSKSPPSHPSTPVVPPQPAPPPPNAPAPSPIVRPPPVPPHASQPARPPPTPTIPRNNGPSPSIPATTPSWASSSTLPPRPPPAPPLADTLMARMTAPSISSPVPQSNGFHSPSMPYQPVPSTQNASRDPRLPTYQPGNGYGSPPQPPGPPYGQR